MGYTHNWTTTMPPGDVGQFMFTLESKYLGHLLPHFHHDLGDDGATILHHKSGQAEGFSLGPCRFEFGESCKTGDGMAEAHIAEMLWRTAFAINDAGGSMRIHSDCTVNPLGKEGLNPDSGLLLAILVHRCADLVQGRNIEVKAVPQHWPQIEEYRDMSVQQAKMLACSPESIRFDQVLFDLNDRNEADFDVVLKPGSANFRGAVYRHTQAFRFHQPSTLRGLLSHTLQVLVDGKVFAGRPGPHDQHPEVLKRAVDLAPMIPSADWLAAEVAGRLAESQEA